MTGYGINGAALAALVLAAASATVAQTPAPQNKAAGPTSDVWKFQGLTFPARDGWCTRLTDLGTPAQPAPSIEAHACGTDFPSLTMTFAQRGTGKAVDVPPLLANAAAFANGADSRKQILEMASGGHKSCTQLSYVTRTDAVPGVPGIATEASYDCTDAPGEPQWIKTFITYASSKSGDVWLISLDYPRGPATSGDVAMLQSAIYTISTH